MKTEDLSLVEAWLALLGDKCVEEAAHGYIYKLIDGHLQLWGEHEEKYMLATGEPLIESGRFRVIPDPSIPEPKSLTMEDAAQLLLLKKPVYIHHPYEGPIVCFKLDTDTLCLLAVAELTGL